MDSLWGEKEAKKTLEFNREIEKIETKYIEVFSDKINVLTGKSPDKLLYQFMTTYDGVIRTCNFRRDTYVPKYIQEEVFEVFNSIFSTI